MNQNDRNINALQYESFPAQQSEGAALKYTINYAAVLGSEEIVASTWSGNTTIATPTNTTTSTAAIISGQPGHYKITNKITTATQTHERIISLHIKRNDNSVIGDYV